MLYQHPIFKIQFENYILLATFNKNIALATIQNLSVQNLFNWSISNNVLLFWNSVSNCLFTSLVK